MYALVKEWVHACIPVLRLAIFTTAWIYTLNRCKASLFPGSKHNIWLQKCILAAIYIGTLNMHYITHSKSVFGAMLVVLTESIK